MFHNTDLERLAKDKHYTLSGPFVSYEENEVLYSQQFVFFETYDWV